MSLSKSSLGRNLPFLKKCLDKMIPYGHWCVGNDFSKPGGKSGLFCNGVRGLSQAKGLLALKVLWKISSVGPIRGCVLIRFE